MVGLAVRVDHVVCAHSLEAQVRELRLLSAYKPAYNRRSKNPHAAWWAVLTEEAFPRLSVVRTPRSGALGPFRSQAAAMAAVEALHDATPIRPCTQRIPARDQRGQPCVLAELARCAAPCAGRQTAAEYAPAVISVRELVAGQSTAPLSRLADSLTELSQRERFEAAGARRDRMVTLVRALDRGQRLATLAAIPELIAARPDGLGGWEFAVIRHGKLASAGVARRGIAPMPVVEALVASAETVLPGPGPLHGAPPEETSLLLRWLDRQGTRLVRTTTPWAEPTGAAAGWREWAERAAHAGAGVQLPD
jgi:DNA polymerase-3 subunit epsilon